MTKKITLLIFAFFFNLSHAQQCLQKLIVGESFFIGIGEGALYGWGENGDRQLGIGSTDDQTSPVFIKDGTWIFVAGSDKHTLAVRSDGTLWAWGSDTYQRLGNGESDDFSFPTQIGTDTNWKEVAAGERASLAIKTDGTLWGWGTNNNGYLGNNTNSSYVSNVPVQIGTDTNWLHIAGNNSLHALAIKSDGTLWGWGKNQNGQLGLGTNVDVQIPTQIGAANDWKWIETGNELSFAIKTNHTLWTSGYSSGGGLPIDVAQFMQVGAASNWNTFSFNKRDTFQYALMTKTDGTLWAWGSDNGEQLGNGAAGNYAAPAQIGTDTDWADATAGYRQGCAIKNNGSFWTWGDTPMVGTGTGLDNSPLSVDCEAFLLSVRGHVSTTGDLRFFPNPSDGLFYLNRSEKMTAKVFDANGRLLLQTQTSENQPIDLAGFAAGIYQVQVAAPDSTHAVRLVRR